MLPNKKGFEWYSVELISKIDNSTWRAHGDNVDFVWQKKIAPGNEGWATWFGAIPDDILDRVPSSLITVGLKPDDIEVPHSSVA